MIRTIEEFAPEGVESGVGLAIQDDLGRYLFFLAGTRHRCPPGELFYAGIGGHREPGETWLACAEREAEEEIGAGVTLLSSTTTWHLPIQGQISSTVLLDDPRPFALYEMIHLEGTPRAGDLYRLVIFCARLLERPRRLPPEEVSGLVALTAEQVIQGPDRKPTLGQLLEEGATVVLEPEKIDRKTYLYPLGTAVGLSYILEYTEEGSSLKDRREKKR